jgi:hypothetical protein
MRKNYRNIKRRESKEIKSFNNEEKSVLEPLGLYT